jgi:hypothetical protein
MHNVNHLKIMIMKKLMPLMLLLISFVAQAQTQSFPIDSTTKRITYSEVIQVEGASQADLYKRSKNLGIAGKGTKKDDPAQGLYVYKGSFKVSYPAPQPGLQHHGIVEYEVTLASKDGRYKYIVTNLVHSGDKASGGKLEGAQPECGKHILTLAGWSAIKKQSLEHLDKLIQNIKIGMAGADVNAPKIGDNW